MKKAIFILLIFFAICISTNSWTQIIKKKVLVLPFSIDNSEELGIIQSDTWNIIIQDLSLCEEINVVAKNVAKDILHKIDKNYIRISDIYAIGKRLDADYVIWGHIIKKGNSIDIYEKLLDIYSYKTPVTLSCNCQGMEEIIPKTKDFSEKVRFFIQKKYILN